VPALEAHAFAHFGAARVTESSRKATEAKQTATNKDERLQESGNFAAQNSLKNTRAQVLPPERMNDDVACLNDKPE